MAAVLVGAVWYTFGLGEARIYRQQMRAAVDAAAFDSSVVHARGMNGAGAVSASGTFIEAIDFGALSLVDPAPDAQAGPLAFAVHFSVR